MQSLMAKKYSFIGGGIIAGVFIERLISSGYVTPQNIMASDFNAVRLCELKEKFGIHTTEQNSECAEFGDVIFLAAPPNQIKIILSEDCKNIVSNKLIISLAAAIPTWLMESVLCENMPVIRVIPNTPSLIGQGMNPYVTGRFVSSEQILFFEKLFSIFGKAVKIQEEKMNLATSLSAVGPTYFFPAMKALKNFALSNGMDEEESIAIISQTISGTAELLRQTGKDPEELKLMIGTRTIDEEGVLHLFTKGVDDAFSKINLSTKKLIE